jgi:ATP-dependent Clp protease adaptor protein ClpS
MSKTLIKTTKPKLKKPKRFQVLLLNDDYTTMDFVIQVLQQFFAKTEQVAHAIMLKIHIDGESVCGIYSYDVAQTKMSQVVDFSRQNEQPLMCVIRYETNSNVLINFTVADATAQSLLVTALTNGTLDEYILS